MLLILLILYREYRASREIYKGAAGGEPHVVDRVTLCSDKNNNLSIKFIIRQTRRPEVEMLIVV